MLAVYNGQGKLLFEFVDGPNYIDEHICLINYKDYPGLPDGKKFYYIQNPVNYSVDKIVDADGNIVETYEYTAYGETTVYDENGTEIPWSNIGNPYGFHGRFYDTESGLYYFRNRMYMPEMKRFISMDPMGFKDSMNMYETFGCDPVNKVDPFGLYGFDTHYLGTLYVLLKAGMPQLEALKLAYFSAVPDIDERYSATGFGNIGKSIWYDFESDYSRQLFDIRSSPVLIALEHNSLEEAVKNNNADYSKCPEWGRIVQETLHQLNGLTFEELNIFRNKLIDEIRKVDNYKIKGILIHVLADTYGHQKIEYIARTEYVTRPVYIITPTAGLQMKYKIGSITNCRKRIVGARSVGGTYSAPLGHGMHGIDPDLVVLRKDLAKEYYSNLFILAGGGDVSELSNLFNVIDNLELAKEDLYTTGVVRMGLTRDKSADLAYDAILEQFRNDFNLPVNYQNYKPKEGEFKINLGGTIEPGKMGVIMLKLRKMIDEARNTAE